MGLKAISSNITRKSLFSFNRARIKKLIANPKYAERENVLKRANERKRMKKTEETFMPEKGISTIWAKSKEIKKA
jgi:hypothetical protein